MDEEIEADKLPISTLLKIHSKPSLSIHDIPTHDNVFRMSEGEKKNREIKEKRSK